MNGGELNSMLNAIDEAKKYFNAQRELYANLADDCRLSGNNATARTYEGYMEEVGILQGKMGWVLKVIKEAEVTLR